MTDKEVVGYVDGLINKKYFETKDLKYPVQDVRIKVTHDIKAGEVFYVGMFQQVKQGVTGDVAYSGTIYRNKQEEKQGENN